MKRNYAEQPNGYLKTIQRGWAGVRAMGGGFSRGSGTRALRITSVFYVFLGIIYVCRGVLNGVGDAVFSFINGIVEIAGRVGLPLLLLTFTAAGVWSIWITAGVTWMLAGICCVLRYLHWKKKNLNALRHPA